MNAAIAQDTACLVFAINPFIDIREWHTKWRPEWASVRVVVICSHRFGLLHLENTSAHGVKWLFVYFRPSFCFPLKFSTSSLQNLTLLFRNLQKDDLKSCDPFSIRSWSCVAASASCWLTYMEEREPRILVSRDGRSRDAHRRSAGGLRNRWHGESARWSAQHRYYEALWMVRGPAAAPCTPDSIHFTTIFYHQVSFTRLYSSEK